MELRPTVIVVFCLVTRLAVAQVVTTFAGGSAAGGTDGTGTAARFFNLYGIALDSSGNLWVADNNAYKIRKTTTPGAVVTTFAGSGSPGIPPTDATGTGATFGALRGIAADSSGNLWVAEGGGGASANHIIRKITSGAVVTTFAGLAENPGSTDGTGSAARFNNPTGIAVDSSGNLWVADSNNQVIRKITSGAVVTTFAGLAGTSGSTDGTGSAARFSAPSGIAVDSSGNLWVAESTNHIIRKITSGAVVTTFAGLAGTSGSTDGTGSAARFNNPRAIAVDSSGNLWVADSTNHIIRKITSGAVVTTFAGLAGTSGSTDGTGSAARFNNPQGIAVDSSGNLWVADSDNFRIRRIAPEPTTTTTSTTTTSTTTSTTTTSTTASTTTSSTISTTSTTAPTTISSTTAPTTTSVRLASIPNTTAAIPNTTSTTSPTAVANAAAHVVWGLGLALALLALI